MNYLIINDFILILIALSIYLVRKKKRLSKKKNFNITNFIINNHAHNNTYLSGALISNRNTTIGKFVSVSEFVAIGPSQHPKNFLSTHPFGYGEFNKKYGSINNKGKYYDISNINQPCNIGNDVWIGRCATIKDGVKIGDGAIIGSNAVVTKDVPPYAVVGGVPAKILGYRFEEEIIKDLIELKWWDLPEDFIITLPLNNIKECIVMIRKFKSLP